MLPDVVDLLCEVIVIGLLEMLLEVGFARPTSELVDSVCDRDRPFYPLGVVVGALGTGLSL